MPESPNQASSRQRRANWVALRTLRQLPKVVGETAAGEPIYEVRSIRLLLDAAAGHFVRLARCSRCGRELAGAPVLTAADLDRPLRPMICGDCIRSAGVSTVWDSEGGEPAGERPAPGALGGERPAPPEPAPVVPAPAASVSEPAPATAGTRQPERLDVMEGHLRAVTDRVNELGRVARAHQADIKERALREEATALRDELNALRASTADVRAELDRLAGAQAGLEGLAGMRAELDRLAGMRAELDRLAGAQAELAGVAGMRAELDGLAGVRAELDQLAGMRAELDRLAGAQAELEGVAGMRAELDRLAGAQAELERRWEAGGPADEAGARAELEGLAGMRDELDRLAGVRAELEGVAGMRAELDRLAGAQAELERRWEAGAPAGETGAGADFLQLRQEVAQLARLVEAQRGEVIEFIASIGESQAATTALAAAHEALAGAVARFDPSEVEERVAARLAEAAVPTPAEPDLSKVEEMIAARLAEAAVPPPAEPDLSKVEEMIAARLAEAAVPPPAEPDLSKVEEMIAARLAEAETRLTGLIAGQGGELESAIERSVKVYMAGFERASKELIGGQAVLEERIDALADQVTDAYRRMEAVLVRLAAQEALTLQLPAPPAAEVPAGSFLDSLDRQLEAAARRLAARSQGTGRGQP